MDMCAYYVKYVGLPAARVHGIFSHDVVEGMRDRMWVGTGRWMAKARRLKCSSEQALAERFTTMVTGRGRAWASPEEHGGEWRVEGPLLRLRLFTAAQSVRRHG
jgi:hypothetical protein